MLLAQSQIPPLLFQIISKRKFELFSMIILYFLDFFNDFATILYFDNHICIFSNPDYGLHQYCFPVWAKFSFLLLFKYFQYLFWDWESSEPVGSSASNHIRLIYQCARAIATRCCPLRKLFNIFSHKGPCPSYLIVLCNHCHLLSDKIFDAESVAWHCPRQTDEECEVKVQRQIHAFLRNW